MQPRAADGAGRAPVWRQPGRQGHRGGSRLCCFPDGPTGHASRGQVPSGEQEADTPGRLSKELTHAPRQHRHPLPRHDPAPTCIGDPQSGWEGACHGPLHELPHSLPDGPPPCPRPSPNRAPHETSQVLKRAGPWAALSLGVDQSRPSILREHPSPHRGILG